MTIVAIADQDTDTTPTRYDIVLIETADGILPLYSATAIVHEADRSYCGQSVPHLTRDGAIEEAAAELARQLKRPLVRGDVCTLEEVVEEALAEEGL